MYCDTYKSLGCLTLLLKYLFEMKKCKLKTGVSISDVFNCNSDGYIRFSGKDLMYIWVFPNGKTADYLIVKTVNSCRELTYSYFVRS